jgi:hypothetical protein
MADQVDSYISIGLKQIAKQWPDTISADYACAILHLENGPDAD